MKLKLLLAMLFFAACAMAQPHPSATLAWSWAQGTGDMALGFHVQRSTTTGGPYTIINTLPVTTLTYLDTAVAVGATYYYVITAYNNGGDSSKSNEVACTLPFQIPGAPTTLSGTVK
jgi:fibronectin type 3 domain-containing protein